MADYDWPESPEEEDRQKREKLKAEGWTIIDEQEPPQNIPIEIHMEFVTATNRVIYQGNGVFRNDECGKPGSECDYDTPLAWRLVDQREGVE